MRRIAIPLLGAAALVLPLVAVSAEPSAESKAAYEAACARCHDVGMMGAPVTSEPGDWANREARMNISTW